VSMSNSIPNIANIAADFMGQFHGRHMILFAGKSTLDKDLEGVVSPLPWSCIITSRSDGAFSNSFIVNDRQVKDFYRPEEVPSRPLNKVGILPILHICGDTQTIDDDIREELSLIGQTVEEYQNDKMNEIQSLNITNFPSDRKQYMYVGLDEMSIQRYDYFTNHCVFKGKLDCKESYVVLNGTQLYFRI